MAQEELRSLPTVTRYGTCNFCDSMCGLEFKVSGDEIIDVRGDKGDPFSQGHICPKAMAQKQLFDDPDRLRNPVRRRGTDWEEIGWDEAYAEVAERCVGIQKRYGADALGLYYGNPLGHNYQGMLAMLAFIKTLGTKSVYSSNSVDALPRMLVSKLLYGNQALLPVPDIDRTALLVVMGANPMVSNGSVMSAPNIKGRLRAIRERGGKVVVIDPRRTETADVADEHIFVRPGTDALLLLAVHNTLFADGHIAPNAAIPLRNLEEFGQLVAEFSPERVASACGVPADTIRSLARQFAAAESAAWYGRMGTSTQRFGVTSTWLIDVLNVVTGNFDRAGGVMFTTPAADLAGVARLLGETGKFDRYRSRVGNLPEFNGEFPVGALADEIESPGEGQIRALVTVAGNPVLSNPNGRRLDGALAGLEYMASVDFYVNETTRHADLILPAATPVEGDHYPMLEAAMAVRNSARYAKAIMPLQGDVRHDWKILLDLAREIGRTRGLAHRLTGPIALLLQRGLGSGKVLDFLFRLGSQKVRLRDLEENVHGIDFGPLEPRAAKVLNTPRKSIDVLPELIVNDAARAAEELTTPFGAADGELLLISRRTLRSMNSWLHNAPVLVKGPNRCTLMMHPDDAAAREIQKGQSVRLTSRVGEIVVEIAITREMMPGVVCMPYGWGHDREGAKLSVASQHAGASMNDVVDEKLIDELGGTAVVDGVPVRVRRTEPELETETVTEALESSAAE